MGLRNEIYLGVLCDSQTVKVIDPGSDDFNPHRWAPPALLEACTQIRNEAALVYYGCSVFEIFKSLPGGAFLQNRVMVQDHEQVFGKWLTLFGEMHRSLVRRISLFGVRCYQGEVDERIARRRTLLQNNDVAVPRTSIKIRRGM